MFLVCGGSPNLKMREMPVILHHRSDVPIERVQHNGASLPSEIFCCQKNKRHWWQVTNPQELRLKCFLFQRDWNESGSDNVISVTKFKKLAKISHPQRKAALPFNWGLNCKFLCDDSFEICTESLFTYGKKGSTHISHVLQIAFAVTGTIQFLPSGVKAIFQACASQIAMFWMSKNIDQRWQWSPCKRVLVSRYK